MAAQAVLDTLPPEMLVHVQTGPCGYLEDREWSLPLRWPVRALTGEELDLRLEAGDRRQGSLLYRPNCATCQECVPIRVDVARFEPNRSQRRALAAGDRALRVGLGPLAVSPDRVRLYNRHKRLRGLSKGDDDVDEALYERILVDTCCDSLELRYRIDGVLVGVAIVDRGDRALSAVYCYYEPDFARLSLGTYSILKQIELCRAWGLSHLYLGLYVASCPTMAYKARYLPHERLVDGVWRTFER